MSHTFFFKVLTYPRSVPMKVIYQLPSLEAAKVEAQELYKGTGEGAGAWVKLYAQDPDEYWLSTPSPLLELPGGEP